MEEMNLEKTWNHLKLSVYLEDSIIENDEQDSAVYYLSQLCELYGYEKITNLLYLMLPKEYDIKWNYNDIKRALYRERHLKENKEKRNGKKYKSKIWKFVLQWKGRKDRFKPKNHDPNNILKKDVNDLTPFELLELQDVKFYQRMEWEYENPDFIIEQAKKELSRTSFWRFKKEIADYPK
ncbi:hypothetical protein [Methanobacterium spitsbergense]|uniref:Uncharacterized protein n=1 Tax=Methanobacterium spitsbergense TaxID=2874285 RepID=A0A8T5USK9_9EURY|nr:hypothetical protein [Methanobacterium spitsbergense]MBZ2167042.1 hypothetical protein [Methanobacterium spitsbergense]